MSVSVRHDREYSQRELNEARWLRLVITTAGLSGDKNLDQGFDYSGACPTCGAGAVPKGPLLAQLSKMGKKLLDATAHSGNLVAHRTLVARILGSNLSGIEVRPVRRSVRQAPDPDYAWLRVTGTWPRMSTTSSLATDDLCPECGRTGFFDPADRPMDWHYASPPETAADFNCTWERFGYWRGAAFAGRGVGGAPGFIVSQRVRELFEQSRVRRVRYRPISFSPEGGMG